MRKRLYVWGSGGNGQLGVGTRDDHALPQRWETDQIQVESVISGGCHSAGIDHNGRLFLWGSNDRGQLGRTTSMQTQTMVNSLPASVASLPRDSKTKRVACGWKSTILVTSSANDGDRVFSWGSNNYYQLGRPLTAAEPSAQIVHGLSRIQVASIACGWKHSLLATTDGVAFAWGSGRHGQLGLDTLQTKVPKRIEALTGTAVAQVVCGWEHSVFRSFGGEIFTCGNNRHGQLGAFYAMDSIASEPLRKQVHNVPVRVADPRDSSHDLRAVQVDCGWHFVMCILETGELVAWGKGTLGQLGLGGLESTCEPKVVPFTHSVCQLTCGSEHSMVLTTRGDLYTCGWGEHGNLGHGDKSNQTVFKKIEFFTNLNQEVISLAAGGAVSMAVTGSLPT